MLGAAVVEQIYNEHHVFPYAEFGKGAGLITGAFGVALAALAAYLSQDKKPTAPLPIGPSGELL